MAPSYKYQPQTLKGKKVIVSGGTTGIGRAIALRLVSDGAHVVTFGLDETTRRDALADLEPAALSGGGSIVALVADQTERADVKRVFAEADQVLGGLDILINNAALGVSGVSDTDIEAMEYAVKTNVVGYLACCHHAIERMRKAGEGHIVNIGSMSAEDKGPGGDIYVATKSAVRGFSASLRKKLADDRIKVTLIEPGLVGTDMTASGIPPAEQPAAIEAETMLPAEDIAECVHYALIQPKRCAIVTIQIQPLKSR